MKDNMFSKDTLKDFLLIILGSFITSIGVNMFLVKANLLSSGVTGVALIFQYILEIPSGYVVLILNIPLFILSFMKLSKRFTLYSLLGVLSLSGFLIITRSYGHMINSDDLLLLCLYGGIIKGIGMGIILGSNGSTGGFDIIAMLIKKNHSEFNIGTISFCINLIIVLAGMLIFGLEIALYTLIAIFISSYLIDYLIKGINKRKIVFIITEKEDEVSSEILSHLRRGVTYLMGEGAYTKVQKKVIYCIVSSSQLPELKRMIINIDPKALITISDASEVQGKGFKGEFLG